MKHVKRSLLIFTRYPVPGRVKTRLIPALGPEGAVRIHKALTEHAVAQARICASVPGIEIEVCYDGGNEKNMQDWLGNNIIYKVQGDGDLGARMERAFRDAFLAGMEHVVIIGSDCPELNKEHLSNAFSALDENDLVLGPAADGGYYLIGLRIPAPFLFEGIDWGNENVRSSTLEIAGRHGLKTEQLELLSDIDRPEDLTAWEERKNLIYRKIKSS